MQPSRETLIERVALRTRRPSSVTLRPYDRGTPQQLLDEAARRGYGPGTQATEFVAWLKDEYDVGRGHAMALYGVLKNGPAVPEKHVGSTGSHRDETLVLRLDGIAARQGSRNAVATTSAYRLRGLLIPSITASAPTTGEHETLVAALAVADESRLDAATARAVTACVDITPMALYRHVADKVGLLDDVRELAHRHPAAIGRAFSRPSYAPAVRELVGVIHGAFAAGLADLMGAVRDVAAHG